MGGYIAVGAICLFVGVFVGCVIMSLMVACKNNDEYYVAELNKEDEDGGNW